MRTLDLRQSDLADPGSLLPRAELDVEAAVEVVRPICAAVAERGAEALLELSERFDRVRPEHLRVPAEAMQQALAELDPTLREAVELAVRRRRQVSEAELGTARTEVELAPGALVAQRMIPVRRVGLYVPGGLAPLSSSVIMNVVPAQVAGVESIAVASPPQAEFGGLPHPTILAVCALLGVEEVYAVGGAQAVAMFAHGVEGLCRRVDLVTGPGNIYVVAAKRLLKGLVGIDSEAGPTEIAVLADAGADPRLVAADLVSQAEHDPSAGSVLVTDSEALAEAVAAELAVQVSAARHGDRIRAALGGPQSATVLVRDLEQGLVVVDAYGAEHLEIHTADAERVAARVRNAGAIFVGPWSPVSLGDYCAGSTHVLPTGGAAAHSSGLNVKSFLRAVNVISYDRDALRLVARHIEAMAEAEDLPAHGAAVSARFA
nr:histidinol dehydrogenase [Auraticoccus cholistanensis]